MSAKSIGGCDPIRDTSGCEAQVDFQGPTKPSIILMQPNDGKSWAIFISNPKWDSWIAKKKQHFLWIVALNPNNSWKTRKQNGACTHWKALPLHDARHNRKSPLH
jgi:hypothetical protein